MFIFEGASIKESNPRRLTGTGIPTRQNGFTTGNRTLRDLIAFSLHVQPYQVTGGSPWLDDLRFDVTVLAERPEADRKSQETPQERTRARVRRLLEAHFQLQLREEKKEMSVYTLESDKAVRLKLAPGFGSMGVTESYDSNLMQVLGIEIQALGVDMAQLCDALGNILERPVVDRTGLAETYDFQLKFALGTSASGKENEEFAGASLSTALKEQLGLRLTRREAPVSTWVIERAEKPPGLLTRHRNVEVVEFRPRDRVE